MNSSEALELIRSKVASIAKSNVEIKLETDLIEEGILDSLDGMAFIMEIEQASGKKIPEDIDLVEEGFYKVSKLVDFLTV